MDIVNKATMTGVSGEMVENRFYPATFMNPLLKELCYRSPHNSIIPYGLSPAGPRLGVGRLFVAKKALSQILATLEYEPVKYPGNPQSEV